MHKTSNLKFKNTVGIVTGAAMGIGFEIAKKLALEGADVLLNDLDDIALSKALNAIQDEGGNCLGLAGNAGDPKFVQRLVETCVAKFGRLDMAVANAGLTRFNSILEIEPEELQSMLQLNLHGSVFLAKFAARQMIEQGEGGRIVFMSSVTGHQAHPGVVCYGMTKAALRMLAKGLVSELAHFGITTNAISPGATITERTVGDDPLYENKWRDKTPTGQVTQAIDIANTAVWLLSNEAKQVTGQTIVVDGGWTSLGAVPNL
jgi:glucose 1-dehydrogenase